MLFYINKRNGIKATLEFVDEKKYILHKGSNISPNIATSPSFRGAKTIEKLRNQYKIENGILMENIQFKSSSSAANFVTGNSSNGLILWRDENGKTLKEFLKEGIND